MLYSQLPMAGRDGILRVSRRLGVAGTIQRFWVASDRHATPFAQPKLCTSGQPCAVCAAPVVARSQLGAATVTVAPAPANGPYLLAVGQHRLQIAVISFWFSTARQAYLFRLAGCCHAHALDGLRGFLFTVVIVGN